MSCRAKREPRTRLNIPTYRKSPMLRRPNTAAHTQQPGRTIPISGNGWEESSLNSQQEPCAEEEQGNEKRNRYARLEYWLLVRTGGQDSLSSPGSAECPVHVDSRYAEQQNNR